MEYVYKDINWTSEDPKDRPDGSLLNSIISHVEDEMANQPIPVIQIPEDAGSSPPNYKNGCWDLVSGARRRAAADAQYSGLARRRRGSADVLAADIVAGAARANGPDVCRINSRCRRGTGGVNSAAGQWRVSERDGIGGGSRSRRGECAARNINRDCEYEPTVSAQTNPRFRRLAIEETVPRSQRRNREV